MRPGGLALLDDTLVRGRVAAVSALNAHIHADPRVDMVLLPWRDGLTVARKK